MEDLEVELCNSGVMNQGLKVFDLESPSMRFSEGVLEVVMIFLILALCVACTGT